jgi:uncharacterized Tic20 family protein
MPCGNPVPPPQAGPTEEEKTLAMLCHLLGILTGFIGPLILWLVKKDTSRFIDFHGRESLNFQITLFIVMFTLGILAMVLMFAFFVGILVFPVIIILSILALIAEILAAVAAQKGEWHRYPCCIRFL